MNTGDILIVVLTAIAIGIWVEIKAISNMYEGRNDDQEM